MQVKSGTLSAEYKVKGGKLLRCELGVSGNRIACIKLSGDFFMYPEEKIEELEAILVGVEMKKEKIAKKLKKFFKEVKLVGATPQNFVELILKTIP